MKIASLPAMRKLFGMEATRMDSPNQLNLDLREEYANAFRTESYVEFWTRVLELNEGNSATSDTMGPAVSTSASRLPSYRLFAEHLLDPDQDTASRILSAVRIRPKNHSLLTDYFSETAQASLLCGLLLKDVDHTRVRYKSLKATLDSLQKSQVLPVTRSSKLLTRLSKISNSFNSFTLSGSYPNRLQATQTSCSDLLKRLESGRDKAQAKLRQLKGIKRGSAVLLVALTASLTALIAAHALAIIVAAPGLMVVSFDILSSKKLAKLSAQLDSAAKGTYILVRDLDTISRVVARLNDELGDMNSVVKFWLEKREDWLQAVKEMARQLKKVDANFCEQLDELEEHLYLCFMTINRARNLVMKEISDPAQSDPGPISSTT